MADVAARSREGRLGVAASGTHASYANGPCTDYVPEPQAPTGGERTRGHTTSPRTFGDVVRLWGTGQPSQLCGGVLLDGGTVAEEDDLRLQSGEFANRLFGCPHVTAEVRHRALQPVDGVGDRVTGDEHPRIGVEDGEVAGPGARAATSVSPSWWSV